MASRSLDDLDPALRELANRFLVQCLAEGIRAFITQTYRSSAEQNGDYAQGRTTPGKIITNARGGQSPHNCTNGSGAPAAKAIDFAIKTEEGSIDWDASDTQWIRAIEIGESLGLVSGSTFHTLIDNPHFELENWHAATES